MRISTPIVIVVSWLAMTAAPADELFRKGGEWRSTVTGIGPAPQTMVMCFSQLSWQEAITRPHPGSVCTKRDFSRTGNQVTIDMDCDKFSVKGTATLSGDSAYTADLTMRMGAGSNAKLVHSVTESKWIGECKPGEKVF